MQSSEVDYGAPPPIPAAYATELERAYGVAERYFADLSLWTVQGEEDGIKYFKGNSEYPGGRSEGNIPFPARYGGLSSGLPVACVTGYFVVRFLCVPCVAPRHSVVLNQTSMESAREMNPHMQDCRVLERVDAQTYVGYVRVKPPVPLVRLQPRDILSVSHLSVTVVPWVCLGPGVSP